MIMMPLASVGIGEMFAYDGGLFVVLPYDWDDLCYYNVCVASINRPKYEPGDKMVFDDGTEVEYVAETKLLEFIPK
jgi:hypothetical protein